MMQNTPTDRLELSCYGALAKEESETKCDIVLKTVPLMHWQSLLALLFAFELIRMREVYQY